MAGIFDFLFGSKDKLKKKSTLSPQQGQFLSSLFSQLGNLQGQGGGYQNAMGLLQQYLNPQSDVYENFEEPYLRQFEEEDLPNIAERFAGGASGGALSSSGFGQALGGARAGLRSNLAGLKSGMQRGAAQDIFGQYNNLASLGLGTSPFAYGKQQGSQGLLPTALGFGMNRFFR